MSANGGSPTRWSEVFDGDAEAYQRRFDDLAAGGENPHGEADLVASLAPPRGKILDAGCGTGRVAAELTRRGFSCLGVDADPRMIEVARQRDPETTYEVQDLSRLLLRGRTFDVVVLAGNVVPLLAPGTLAETMRRIAGQTHPGGRVVAGFGLDAAHLPTGCPTTPVDDYDGACRGVGLEPVLRFSTWDRAKWTTDDGYVVAIHVLR